jgi:hypothetical protein
MSRFLKVMLAVAPLALLASCAGAGAWCHDNLPLIGRWFPAPPFVPSPVWQVVWQWIGDAFTQHPAEAIPATSAAVVGVAHLAGRIPGTHRHAKRLERKAAKKSAKARVDAHLKHWDAQKSAEVAQRKADAAAKVAAAKVAQVSLAAPAAGL